MVESTRLDEFEVSPSTEASPHSAADGLPSPPVSPLVESIGEHSAPPRRLLFLDDDPRRAEVFLELNPEAVWVQTTRECIARLADPWEEVHLDHDLGGEHFVDMSRTDCGMEVVRWLCRELRPHLSEAKFIIHSHNFAAALMMVLLMRDTGYVAEFHPFGFNLEMDPFLSESSGMARESADRGKDGRPDMGRFLNWIGSFFPVHQWYCARRRRREETSSGPRTEWDDSLLP
jgi:hypothetical protein